jgi:hypothetical protein
VLSILDSVLTAYFAIVVTSLYCFAFIVPLLSATYTNQNFDKPAFIEVKLNGDNGVPPLSVAIDELFHLPTMQEKFAITARIQ